MTTTDFSGYFRSLVAALGGQPGWYGAFAARRPGVARAYEAGAELPPWDVVHTVLHDAAAAHGGVPGPAEIARARSLHQAAVATWDAAPGAEPSLRARLDAAVREEDAAARREHQAAARVLAATPSTESAASLAALHAWTRDDHRRAASRRAELHTRLLSLHSHPEDPATGANRPAGGRWVGSGAEPAAAGSRVEPGSGPGGGAWPAEVPGPGGGDGAAPVNRPAGGRWVGSGAAPASAGSRGEPGSALGGGTWPAEAPRPGGVEGAARANRPAGGRWVGSGAEPARGGGSADEGAPPASGRAGGRWVGAPRGARFAGAPQVTGEGGTVSGGRGVGAPRGARFAGAPQAEGDGGTVPDGRGVRAPRGARFAGAAAEAPRPAEPAEDPRWSAEARAVVARLGQARAAGEGGGTYVLLCRAAAGPAERLPYLVRELERAGYGADVATLLWEVAVLPAPALADAARALAVHGRHAECRTLLQQVASRPAEDIAAVAADLPDPARTELLSALVRTHPPEAAAGVARLRPALTTPLLTAAGHISPSRRHDLTAAFHRAGLPTT